MTPPKKRFWGYLLQSKDDEDYWFSDWEHAVGWMRQPYIQNVGYRVFVATYRKRDCCGEPFAIKKGAIVLQ